VVVALVGVLFGGLALGATLALYRLLAPPRLPASPVAPRAMLDATRVPAALPSVEARVYPYSVVPGGVQSGAEVARAMADDPVVATHYARVRVAQLRRTRLARPRDVSVSYRLGGRVYWTRKTVRIRAGEEVLTDGTTEIRPRCGNCIAPRPPGETRDDEPSVAVLDTPIVPAGGLPDSPLRDPLEVLELLAGPAAGPGFHPPAAPDDAPVPAAAGLGVPGGGAGPGVVGQPGLHVSGGQPGARPPGGGGTGWPGEGGPGEPGGGEPGGGNPGEPGGGRPGEPGGSEPVPEPAGLAAAGLAAAAWLARRRRRGAR
jgi:hypothetical protein